MIIPIDTQFRIKSDRYQWVIQERRTRKGGEAWESKLFFGTFQLAVKELGELMVRLSGADTLADALEEVVNVNTTLSQALTPQLEEVLETTRNERRRKTKDRINEG
jgi:NTP pyrophosphatase (non-canonical NTP hydrolase)